MDHRVVFERIEIEGFRGFGIPQSIDLNATATVVVGTNGTGKTSFFDAIQWLLIGDIPRLKARANKRSEDYILNTWNKDRPAKVSAELRVGEAWLEVTRTGNAGSSILGLADSEGVFEGREAGVRLKECLYSGDGFSLQEAVTTVGMLQQDALLSVIEEDPKQRYLHLARLLGLELLQDYERTVRITADARGKSASTLRSKLDGLSSELQEARIELASLSESLSATPSTQRLQMDLDRVLQLHAHTLRLRESVPLNVDGMTRLGTATRRVRERTDDLLLRRRLLDSRPGDDSSPATPSIAEVDARIAEIEVTLERIDLELLTNEERLDQLEDGAKSLAELASRALPLLGPRCPVCNQDIDRESVANRLESLLLEEEPTLRSVRAKVAALRNERLALDQALRHESRQRDQILQMQEQIARQEQEMIAFSQACAELVLGVDVLIPEDKDGVISGDRSALEAIRQATVTLEQAATEIAAALGVPELARKHEEQRLKVADLETSLASLRDDVTNANREAKEVRALVHATTDGITNLTRRRFEQLLPLIREIYSRLDPHPAFTKLDYDLDVYWRRSVADPIVIDEELDVRADPLLVFSSSQANVAALTFFLALGWSAGSHSLPFLFLDDPLQAMDDINALGFADLCRHVRMARQLVVSTHDRRLGSLLERKLAPRTAGERTRVLRFLGWDRSGPQIEQYEVPPQLEEAERRVLREAA
jgi:DNA repair exonuclease SbcCD ATPase subunit